MERIIKYDSENIEYMEVIDNSLSNNFINYIR